MSLNQISVDEAVKAIREGKHPSEVLFEGSDAAILESNSALRLFEMIGDARTIVLEARNLLAHSYKESGETHEGLVDSLTEMSQISVQLESISHLVKQTGALDDPNQDPRLKKPEDDRDPDVSPVKEGYEPENEFDDMQDAEVVDAPNAPAPEGLEFEVSGVADSSAFQQELNDLVQKHGGVLSAEAEEPEFTSEEIEYKSKGADTKLKDGDKPDDEVGNPKGEADTAIKTIKTPDSKKGATDYHEGRSRAAKLSEGLKVLLSKYTFRKVPIK